MILVTRLNGGRFALNCDLVERVEAAPDTVVTLTDGSRFLIEERVEELIQLVREFRASVLVLAGTLAQDEGQRALHLVPDLSE